MISARSKRLDLGVEVAAADAELAEVLAEVLGGALGQRGDEHALALFSAGADLLEQVVDLAVDRANFHVGVHQAGGADDLLDDDALAALELVGGPGVAET